MGLILLISPLCVCMPVKQPVARYYQQHKRRGVQYRFLEVNWLWLMGRCSRAEGKTHICWCLKSVTWQLSYSVGSSHCHRSKISFNVLMLREITEIDATNRALARLLNEERLQSVFLTALSTVFCLKSNTK